MRACLIGRPVLYYEVMPTPTIKHVIWDWNGTLLNDVQACVDSINRMLSKRNLPNITIKEYRDIFDFPVKSYYSRLGFDLENEDWDAIANEFHQHYAKFSPTAELRPGITDTLKSIAKQGLPMSVLSASEIKILERMLRAHDIRPFFQHVFGLNNLYAASKLDRGRLLLQDLQISPECVLMVGDTNHDYDVAHELGMQCVLITGGHQSKPRLNHTHLISSHHELLAIIGKHEHTAT